MTPMARFALTSLRVYLIVLLLLIAIKFISSCADIRARPVASIRKVNHATGLPPATLVPSNAVQRHQERQ